METYDNIFVVLVYKNASDLEELIESIRKNVESYRIVVVNSYFDRKTENQIQKISENNGCDFFSVENKGYGYGNNQGIKYVKNKYKFKRLIVSNPDIVVRKFDDNVLNELENGIIGPQIITINGKRQNPERAQRIKLSVTAAYQLAVKHNVILFGLGVLIARAGRLFVHFKSIFHPFVKVYAVHGSFVIFTEKAINSLYPIYDENIFMFGEELDLAESARNKRVSSYYTREIEVKHKEDGSIKLSNINVSDETVKVVVYLQNKYWSKKYKRGSTV